MEVRAAAGVRGGVNEGVNRVLASGKVDRARLLRVRQLDDRRRDRVQRRHKVRVVVVLKSVVVHAAHGAGPQAQRDHLMMMMMS